MVVRRYCDCLGVHEGGNRGLWVGGVEKVLTDGKGRYHRLPLVMILERRNLDIIAGQIAQTFVLAELGQLSSFA